MRLFFFHDALALTFVLSIHADKGDMFQVVTPEQVVVNVADADIMMDVLTRKNAFPKYQLALGLSFPLTSYDSLTDAP